MMKNTKENIKTAFAEIKMDATLTTGTRDFIGTLKKHFHKHKRLSDKQFSCLLEIHNSQMREK